MLPVKFPRTLIINNGGGFLIKGGPFGKKQYIYY